VLSICSSSGSLEPNSAACRSTKCIPPFTSPGNFAKTSPDEAYHRLPAIFFLTAPRFPATSSSRLKVAHSICDGAGHSATCRSVSRSAINSRICRSISSAF